MTDRVEETIEVDGWAYENDTLAAMREGRDLGPDGMSGWRIFPHAVPVRDPGARPRQVMVTVEVLADEPTPQRGDVWEDEDGWRVLLDTYRPSFVPMQPWNGVIVHGPPGSVENEDGREWRMWVKPKRLIARLDPGGEQ